MSDDPMVAVYLEAQKWGYELSTTEAAHIAEAALEAVQQTHAVDKVALARVLNSDVVWKQDTHLWEFDVDAAIAHIFASGILLDAAEVKKGLLPEGAEWFPIEGGIVWRGKVYYPADYVLTRRDIAEVEARGLEKAAEAMHWARPETRFEAEQWLGARAQQVREGN